MASTNKTTHYNLSQYVGSDKPTYLVDYNTDMSNIDTGIYDAQSKANNNETNIGNLSSLETTDKTSIVNAINELKGKTDGIGNLSNLTTEANTNLVSAINEVDAHADTNNQNIGTMTNLETTVKTSIVGAVNEVNTKANNNNNLINEISDYFNIKNFNSINDNDISLTNASLVYNNLSSGLNDEGTLGKFYGQLIINKTGDRVNATIPTNIRPNEALTINGGLIFQRNNSTTNPTGMISFNIATNGNLTFEIYDSSRGNINIYFISCLYFFKNFGDIIIPQ